MEVLWKAEGVSSVANKMGEGVPLPEYCDPLPAKCYAVDLFSRCSPWYWMASATNSNALRRDRLGGDCRGGNCPGWFLGPDRDRYRLNGSDGGLRLYEEGKGHKANRKRGNPAFNPASDSLACARKSVMVALSDIELHHLPYAL